MKVLIEWSAWMSEQKVIGSSPLHGRGRVQMPSEIREILGVKDGDTVVWISNGFGEIYVRKGTVEGVQPKRRYIR